MSKRNIFFFTLCFCILFACSCNNPSSFLETTTEETATRYDESHRLELEDICLRDMGEIYGDINILSSYCDGEEGVFVFTDENDMAFIAFVTLEGAKDNMYLRQLAEFYEYIGDQVDSKNRVSFQNHKVDCIIYFKNLENGSIEESSINYNFGTGKFIDDSQREYSYQGDQAYNMQKYLTVDDLLINGQPAGKYYEEFRLKVGERYELSLVEDVKLPEGTDHCGWEVGFTYDYSFDDSPDPEDFETLMKGQPLQMEKNNTAHYVPEKEGDIFYRFTCYDKLDNIVDNIMIYLYVHES